MGIFNYLCCSGCCRRRFEKNNENKAKKDLTKLKSITPSKPPDIWSMTSNPMDVKTEQMSDLYKIPSDKYKTEEDVIKGNGYRIDSFIDSGAFATVHKATNLPSGVTVAIKKILIPSSVNQKMAKKRKNLLIDIKNELYILQSIKHRHIVRLVSHFLVVCNNESTLYIVMQFAPGGNLSQMCDQSGPFSENTCKIWFAQMLSALICVHGKGVAHRDLKLSNILLDENKDVLVSDFGLSRIVLPKNTQQPLTSQTFCGTPPYMSPELLMIYKPESDTQLTYNALAVDVWALGVILFKLFNKEYPFPQIRRQAIKNMKKKVWQFSSDIVADPSPQLNDILMKIFDPDPKTRPKMTELQNHKWIEGVFKVVDEKSVKI